MCIEEAVAITIISTIGVFLLPLVLSVFCFLALFLGAGPRHSRLAIQNDLPRRRVITWSVNRYAVINHQLLSVF